MTILIITVFGAIIGSFLNVCIARLPKGESLVFPNSHCTKCNKPIRVFDNIPIISYLILRGKCRDCEVKIPLRYLIVEILTPLLAIILFMNYGISPLYFVYIIFVFSLIVVVFIDIDHQIIPDIISISGIPLGILFMSFISESGFGFTIYGLKNSVFGMLAGGMSIFLMGVLGEFVFKKEAVGGGDVKLMAMIGAFIGWQKVLLTFFMGPIFGSIIGLYVLFVKKNEVIPYAPYLSLSAFISLLYGDKILGFLFPMYY